MSVLQIHHVFDAAWRRMGRWKMRPLRYLRRHKEGEAILLEKYRRLYGHDLDLECPLTFSAKLFRRMIMLNRKNDPLLTRLADKFAVRDWVRERIGEAHLIRLHWHGTRPELIPFEKLPRDYVVKSNHSSGQVIIVRGQCDKQYVIEKTKGWLRTNLYWITREAHYLPIKPRILVEEFLQSADGQVALDYRFWCFNGVPEMVQVDNDSHTINPFYDTQWRQLELSYRQNVRQVAVARPVNFETMLETASKLSRGFDFVRVDLYNIDGHIYFGEMTFTPVSGSLLFNPPEWNDRLGEKWHTTQGTGGTAGKNGSSS